MDIFKFNNPTAPTKMESGEIVNGITSKMWVERYRDAGEFTIVGPVSAGLKEKLPIGAFISHIDTKEIMIVENHEINEEVDKDSVITITGRGFETFLENRLVGTNKFYGDVVYGGKVYSVSTSNHNFNLPDDFTWIQAQELIIKHIYVSELVDTDDALPWVLVGSSITPDVVGDSIPRVVDRGNVYSAVLKLLAIDNTGIRILRPGSGITLSFFVVHKGVNRTKEIVFTYEGGQIFNADYLWSTKNLKNCALVEGTNTELKIIGTEIEYDRRWLIVDASNVDKGLEGTTTLNSGIVTRMHQKGVEELAKSRKLALAKAELSKESLSWVFRRDFNVGDVVTVMGNYSETSAMRIIEYVEIEDETGEFGYPTLSIDYEGD